MATFSVNLGEAGLTIKALRRKYSDRSYVWTGAAYVAISGLTDVQYLAAMETLTAISTSETATGSYLLTITNATEREWIEFYNAPTGVTDVAFAVQDYEPRTDMNTIDALLDKFAPRLIGTLEDAGTGTEVCAYGGVTATYTVDSEGNISAVEFS